jgi:hypothetical protein
MEEARGGWVGCAVVWVVPAFGDGVIWLHGLGGGVFWVLVRGDVLVRDGVCWFREGVGFEMGVLDSGCRHYGRESCVSIWMSEVLVLDGMDRWS